MRVSLSSMSVARLPSAVARAFGPAVALAVGSALAFALVCASVLAACGDETLRDAGAAFDAGGALDAESVVGDGASGGADGADGAADAGADPGDAAPGDGASRCTDGTGGTVGTAGTIACPIEITSFPYSDTHDTRVAASDVLDRYSCAPATDESGGEVVYRFLVTERARFVAAIDDTAGDGVDIDLNLLSSTSTDACIARDNVVVAALLDPGTYYLVADTWVNSSGAALAGNYHLQARLEPLDRGVCSVTTLDLKMFWTSCAPDIDCYSAVDPADGIEYRYLRTPAIGPVVLEAHLVTEGEDFPNTWPESFTDQIARHYQLSQAETNYQMTRDQPWAPAGEGGSNYGQGATGNKVPLLEEAWYINMYWRQRPQRGTRMIVRNPQNGRAVVAAAGYETGPGSNTAIGGVTEEVHNYLGTGHRDALELGFAVDQTLPYGPLTCP